MYKTWLMISKKIYVGMYIVAMAWWRCKWVNLWLVKDHHTSSIVWLQCNIESSFYFPTCYPYNEMLSIMGDQYRNWFMFYCIILLLSLSTAQRHLHDGIHRFHFPFLTCTTLVLHGDSLYYAACRRCWLSGSFFQRTCPTFTRTTVTTWPIQCPWALLQVKHHSISRPETQTREYSWYRDWKLAPGACTSFSCSMYQRTFKRCLQSTWQYKAYINSIEQWW